MRYQLENPNTGVRKWKMIPRRKKRSRNKFPADVPKCNVWGGFRKKCRIPNRIQSDGGSGCMGVSDKARVRGRILPPQEGRRYKPQALSICKERHRVVIFYLPVSKGGFRESNRGEVWESSLTNAWGKSWVGRNRQEDIPGMD